MFQTVFTKGRKTEGNIFWIKICVGIYLRAKRSRLFWCFVDFERCVSYFRKASDSISREALWFKMRKTGVSNTMINCIRIMYQDIKFCVKCGG